jgi:hypothetical protein
MNITRSRRVSVCVVKFEKQRRWIYLHLKKKKIDEKIGFWQKMKLIEKIF